MPHGVVWVQRPIGKATDPEYFSTKEPHPARLSIWGCFSARGVGKLFFYRVVMDAKLFKVALRTCLIPSALNLYKNDPWWFLQDNDPKHKALITTNYLFSLGVQCLDFPPYSPDLNPIENVWSYLKRRVEARNCKDLDELEKAVKEEWDSLDEEYLSSLSHSMPARCKAVITQGGHKTTY